MNKPYLRSADPALDPHGVRPDDEQSGGVYEPKSDPKWPRFYFNGNHAWGWIESREDWEWLKGMYAKGWNTDKDAVAARLMDALSIHTGVNEFGLYGEYACVPSLREFFANHHIDA